MKTYWLRFRLLSDATFGRGDGVAGAVDTEVQHDGDGLPYLGGKTLKSLLVAACAEVLYGVEQTASDHLAHWRVSAQRLFGSPGSGVAEAGRLHVGNAQLPADLRAAIAYDTTYNGLTRETILESLTVLRRQTAMDAVNGAPRKETLRTMRVIIREVPFEARLDFLEEPNPHDLALLAACVKAFRRAGTGRNRGRGRLVAELYEENRDTTGQTRLQPLTDQMFDLFRQEVCS